MVCEQAFALRLLRNSSPIVSLFLSHTPIFIRLFILRLLVLEKLTLKIHQQTELQSKGKRSMKKLNISFPCDKVHTCNLSR